MSATLTWSCDCCALTRDVDVTDYCALEAHLPTKPPVGWRVDAEGQSYCPGAYCQQAYTVALGDVPELDGDTRDTL